MKDWLPPPAGSGSEPVMMPPAALVTVANGVPRVSGDRPRLIWKVSVKSRSVPSRISFSFQFSVPHTFQRSSSMSPMPPSRP